MLREPAAFGTAVEALFAAKKQAVIAGSVAAGEHICFVGSGREEEDQYVHMVVASFLQKHQRYISLAQGGYEGNLFDVFSNIYNHMQKFGEVKKLRTISLNCKMRIKLSQK